MSVDLSARLPALEKQAQEYERKAQALRQIIEGVKALNGDLAGLLGDDHLDEHAALDEQPVAIADEPSAPAPRGRAAIRLIVSERPGLWQLAQIKHESQQRGWPASIPAIEHAVARLARDGELERVRQGVYRYPPEPKANEVGMQSYFHRTEGDA